MLMTIAMVGSILGVGWAQYRNGLFSSCVMLINVLIAGLVAFNFFEPIAELMEPRLQGNACAGCEDFIALIALFCVALLSLRVAANRLSPELLDEHGVLQFFGAGALGMLIGYLVSGFLLCAMQTLPLDERFLDFEPRDANEPSYRSIYPGDRVWLAMMRHAGAKPFRWKDAPTADDELQPMTFDQAGTFELRYLRHRRSTGTRPPLPYLGEFDREIGKKLR